MDFVILLCTRQIPRICRATAASLKMFEARRLIGPEREEGGVTAKLMISTRLVWFGLFFIFLVF